MTSARRGLGRRGPTEPASHGERVDTLGSEARSARTSLGPWRSIAAAGPRSRIANGAESPKCSRRMSLAREDSVPGMSSEVGLSLLSTPVPRIPRTSRVSVAAARTARGCRSRPLLLEDTRGSLAFAVTEGARTCGKALLREQGEAERYFPWERPVETKMTRRSRIMRAALPVAVLCLLTLWGGGAAGGALIQVGNLILVADGGFRPQHLPRHAYAPIDFRGHADIHSVNGGTPPELTEAIIDFDRDG